MEMENADAEVVNFLDTYLSEDHLDKEINNTYCLKLLNILLNLKKRRILDGKCQKIVYPIHKIYEQETEDLLLQREVLKTILSITENSEKGILQVTMYLNCQLNDQVNNSFNGCNITKLARLLNEIILICKTQRKEHLFQQHMALHYLDKFLLYAVQEQSPIRIYILSTAIPNYISLLSELHQLNFLHKIFLQCKDIHNLDILCIIFNYTDRKALLTNSNSFLVSNDFWQYLESYISCDNYRQQKQAIFLLKKCIEVYNTYSTLKYEIPLLQTTDSSQKIWQHFFTLLDASKEKQLHLIWPSLNLLNPLKHVNTIWQMCIYKKLLKHTQNPVVYFVASHILSEKKFFPTLNKHFLSAINKNEFTDYSINMFPQLPHFCNELKAEDFYSFLKDILEITWTPIAAWCLFSNLFSNKLMKTCPFTIAEPIYKLLKRLPHVYIRNGCISIFLNYFVNNCSQIYNFNDVLKLLFILKEKDNDLFIKAVSNHIKVDHLGVILHKIEENIIDVKTFEIFIQIIKILKYEYGFQIISKSIKQLNKKSLVVLYANLHEKQKISDIKNFVLEQITEVDQDCIEMFLLIVKRLMKYDDFSELMYSKILHILNDLTNYNRNTAFIATYIVLNFYKTTEITKNFTKDLKHRFINGGKTDEELFILFLELNFLTEEYPDIPFLEHILHNQSDIIISKAFEYLSNINFHINSIELIHFLKQALYILPHLSKSRYFRTITLNYINCIFSIRFLEILCNSNMLDVLTLMTDYLLYLSEAFPIINYYLSEKIKATVLSPCFTAKASYILISVLEELLLKGVVFKKDEKIEYNVCQEIYETLDAVIDNPNIVKITTRMSSLESMLLIINKNPEYADIFTAGLVKKYKTYFNKRYFPDSQIHLQKLRIIQALLTIHPFINSQRQPLVDLIVESFCTEVHQPCVKQLMQWLLLPLIKDLDNDYFDLIKAKIDTTSKTQPSSIVAFIVVLLHLTLCKEESYWLSTVEAFIPWCMGAHFKLRVYSQVAIKKLLEEAKQKNYEKFLSKYGYLEKSILSVIDASGQAFHDTLKSDVFIFSTFNPMRDYSLETIYVDIPRLNGVTNTEWENVLHYEFITHKNIDIFNKDRTFTESITMGTENDRKQLMTNNISGNIHIIQTKITPWEIPGDERNNKPVSDFILIASLIDKSSNLGGLSRTCEVFGVKQFVLNDIKVLNDKDFKSLSMSSEEWINAIEVKISKLKEFIFEIRNRGYSVIGAEQTSQGICLHKYKFNKKTALILGNEKEGIPPDIIPILDTCIEIPQFGMVRSLNVHVAGATFIWEYAKQHLVE